MTENIKQFLDEKLKELPVWIVERSIETLKDIIIEPTLTDIKTLYSLDSSTWWAGYHHGWGTTVRNYLRQNVCHDRDLPSQNWDDYYIQLVELALELR